VLLLLLLLLLLHLLLGVGDGGDALQTEGSNAATAHQNP
jgi:hypothetical protein